MVHLSGCYNAPYYNPKSSYKLVSGYSHNGVGMNKQSIGYLLGSSWISKVSKGT